MKCKQFMEQLQNKIGCDYKYYRHLNLYLLNNGKFEIQLQTKNDDDENILSLIINKNKLFDKFTVYVLYDTVFGEKFDKYKDNRIYSTINKDNVQYINNYLKKCFNVTIEI